MFRGTGTHFGSPLLGDERAGGGLYEEVPADILSRIARSSQFYDFTDGLDFSSSNNWVVTQIAANGSSTSVVGAANGVHQIDSAAVNNDGIGSFQTNKSFMTASTTDSIDGMDNRIISAGARFSVSDYSGSDWFFGIAEIDSTLMLATGLLAANGADNCVGFQHAGEAVNQGGVSQTDGNDIRLVSAGGGVANIQATLASAAQFPVAIPADAAVDGILIEYGIKIIGTQNVEWYRNGRLVHRRRMSNALANAMCLSFANVSVGASVLMNIDFVWGSASR